MYQATIIFNSFVELSVLLNTAALSFGRSICLNVTPTLKLAKCKMFMMNFCIIDRFLIYQMVNGRPRVNEFYKEQSYHIHQNFNSTNIYIYSFVISFLSIIEILLFIAGEFWEPKHQKLLQQRRVAKTKITRKVFHQKPATLSKKNQINFVLTR